MSKYRDLIEKDYVLNLLSQYEKGEKTMHDVKFEIRVIPCTRCPCTARTTVNQLGANPTMIGKVENLNL